MQKKMIETLFSMNIINNDDERINKDPKDNILEVQRQTEDSVFNIISTSFEEKNGNEKEIKEQLLQLWQMIQSDDVIDLYIFFENFENERNIFRYVETTLSGGSEKRKVNELYNFMTSIYTKVPETVCLSTDNSGINYLEYNPLEKKDVSGRIYNVSMFELKKLYNVTGESLFKDNVRIGIKNKKLGNDLKDSFKKYIFKGIIENVEKKYGEELYEEFLESVAIDWGTFSDENNPDLFWYKHNGVTIYINDGATLNVENEKIILNPKKVSVINGAQTLTNIFSAEEEIKAYLENNNFNEIFDFSQIMDSTMQKIVTKTIFVNGNEELIKPITFGLNNQIPVSEEDFIANSEIVEKINNDFLKMRQMKILRTGQINTTFSSFTPLQFIKNYLMADLRPGKSKNYSRKNMASDIKKSYDFLKKEKFNLDKIDLINEVGKWWNENKTEQNIEESFLKYGKNYFQSFVIFKQSSKDDITSYVDEDFNIYLNELNSYLAQKKADANNFKSDELFKSIIDKISEKNKEDSSDKYMLPSRFEDYESKLTAFVKQELRNNYTVGNVIKKFNKNNKIKVLNDYFRTISVVKKTNKLKEHFPLPNSTFSEFYESKEYLNDSEKEVYPQFENSKLKKEIEKRYTAYIVYWDDTNKISDIKFIEDFSISNLNESESKAKVVFEKTKKAFQNGDIKIFPKSSEHLGFHVRPKAKNGDTTFEFTDGNDITKQTFWVDKDYMKEVIDACTSS